MKSKLTAILVDDENSSREVLKDLLENFFPEVVLLGEADNVDAAYELVKVKQPQLVFLDIQMPKQSGFNLLKKFDEVPFEVIFVTSFDKYAINAIKFSALDYLLKPIEVKDLREAVDKAQKRIEQKNRTNIQIINLLSSIDEAKERKIVVHDGDVVRLLRESEIISIEADGRYCNIITIANEKFIIAKYVKDFEEYLGTESELVRIHKGCMINSRHIKEYSKGDPCVIEMTNGKTYEVARRKKAEILERLKA